MPDLKLIALDEDDLAVISAHLQDAVIRVADMAYVKQDKRFAALANRFDWQEAASGEADQFARRRCGLRFERVLAAKISGFNPGDGNRVLSLLAINFDAGEAPAGSVTLTFSGDVAIRLDVEFIEGEMKDLGAAWGTAQKPEHEPQS